jgi:YggT family protein
VSVSSLLCDVLAVYTVVIIARIIFSWFPVHSGSTMASINRLLLDLTEPTIAPVRRVLPAAGFLDFSPLVVLIVIAILQHLICGSSLFF